MLCIENKFLATSLYKHLDEPLDEGRFVFECILAGNLQAFTKRLYCAFVWLSVFPGNSVSCYKRNCSFLVTLTERLHSSLVEGQGKCVRIGGSGNETSFIPGIVLSWINPKLISLALR